MSLVRWSPLKDVFSVQDEINKLFDNTFWAKEKDEQLKGVWMPDVNVMETKEDYQIKADLPGLSKEQIDISVVGKNLLIKGERKEEVEEKETNFYRKEISYGSFSRQVTLSENIDEENIKATYKDGVLEVRIPKVEKEKSKQIAIE